MTTDIGRMSDDTGLSQAEPVSRLGPTGFDPSRVSRVNHDFIQGMFVGAFLILVLVAVVR